MTTLVVDADNLLTIGFHGRKNYFYKGEHIGGIFHFISTLQTLLEKHELDKIVVFWDGEEGTFERKKIYPQYKQNRNKKEKSIEEQNSYGYQRNRVKQYLEELHIRQGEYKYCESDDNIAHYVQNSPQEEKIILSSDVDLMLLINDNVKLLNPRTHIIYELDSPFIFEKQETIVKNIKTIKILTGDKSDNIDGVKGLGLKRLIEIVPEIKNEKVDLEFILERCKSLKKPKNILQNMLDGTTKNGNFGYDLYVINEKIISLEKPFITIEAKEDIEMLINYELDSENRSYKNTLRLMTEDGIFAYLPKADDGWTTFLNPFLKLIRKEKNKSIKQNN